jgi:hypothetical protein
MNKTMSLNRSDAITPGEQSLAVAEFVSDCADTLDEKSTEVWEKMESGTFTVKEALLYSSLGIALWLVLAAFGIIV